MRLFMQDVSNYLFDSVICYQFPLNIFTITTTLTMIDFSLWIFYDSGDQKLIEEFITSGACRHLGPKQRKQNMQTVASFLAKLPCGKGLLAYLQVNISFSALIISI